MVTNTVLAMSDFSAMSGVGGHANHVRSTETIKVNLPGGMHTVFQPRKGLLLRDAMDRKLTSRNMRVSRDFYREVPYIVENICVNESLTFICLG